MAKYVILQFDDDNHADAFIVEVQRKHKVYKNTECELENLPFEEVPVIVRGVYRKPTKFCACVGIKKRAFTRGQKYGWWVCNQCKKPTIGWARGDHWFLALGKNLLPVSNAAPEYRGDGNFAFHFKKCEVCDSTLVTEVGHGHAPVYCNICQEWR